MARAVRSNLEHGRYQQVVVAQYLAADRAADGAGVGDARHPFLLMT
jgi:hypothetical protein